MVCYHNKVYRGPRIDERIEYVCEMNNKIKYRDEIRWVFKRMIESNDEESYNFDRE